MRLAGRYEIIAALGNGGFGITYKAIDTQKPSKAICVVKELLPQHYNTVRADFFEKEARILEILGTHSQIPHLLAFFEENKKFYIVQEFIDGQCLDKEILPGKRLSEGYVIKLLQDVLEVLAFVHQQQVIHRDIKPQNLIRRQQDGKVCLIDFGIVKELASQILNSSGSLQTSIMAGTIGYMPTEQVRGKTVFASDIYALGITAIQALTGLRPQNIEEDPQTAELSWQQEAQVSANLAAFLTKMVRRHHGFRYQNAQAALEDLRKLNPSLPTAILSPQAIVPPARNLYYQEAATLAKQGNGQFSPVMLKRLETKRLDLGLSEQEAQEIRQAVLQTYREYNSQLQTSQNLHQTQPSISTKSSQNSVNRTIHKSRSQQPPKTANKVVSQPQSLSIIQTQPFEFETAQLISKPGFLGLGTTWVIQRSKKTVELFIEDLENGIVLELVAIPSGTFLMGSTENEIESADKGSPQHQVTIQPFLLGKYPITQAQWQAVSNLPKIKIDLYPDPSHFKGANRPVEQISWHEAQEFCARLSRKTGKLYRLPSESEWEYACRAGTTTPFYFGNTISTDLANYNGEYVYANGSKGIYRKETTNVGFFPANAFGLHDMHGLVWEWCEDGWYNTYIGAPTNGSARLSGSDSHPRRVLRGGSWSYRPVYCRSAYRVNYPAASRDLNHGFRIACSAKWS
ncbi:SUMF1/EgtB/PvdO family nonheme iron enzyme [Sphaerospermopsis aphanizomenoides BCCUSP55]|uniref:bifunctional serine/threonine-protein kinase/formylglycine-generating enzyme family protein n=1 Tax=Sphaerospermopsis aphanizomenoides TaxID=459663 RepID=UPI0019062E30|nr:bifunctional serine/threonine-protein kinase/formylglycine-generating enzyme family protein [Sphaerospermopsis aphanizomenoides]MBK1987087.1 SUMF1/EgtB/PvdO family nonheme iron enzyme [Sphaerospermopsis aphanizomenoides BCCUSP55]